MANNNATLSLNGHTFADAKATFNGVELAGISSLNFEVSQDKMNNIGMGVNPYSRSRKGKVYSGSMTMDDSTADLLRNLSPDGLLTGLPAGVLVLTLDNGDDTYQVYTLSAFEFNKDGISGSQGDDVFTIAPEVIFAGMAIVKI